MCADGFDHASIAISSAATTPASATPAATDTGASSFSPNETTASTRDERRPASTNASGKRSPGATNVERPLAKRSTKPASSNRATRRCTAVVDISKPAANARCERPGFCNTCTATRRVTGHCNTATPSFPCTFPDSLSNKQILPSIFCTVILPVDSRVRTWCWQVFHAMPAINATLAVWVPGLVLMMLWMRVRVRFSRGTRSGWVPGVYGWAFV